MIQPVHSPARISKVYVVALTESSHIVSKWSQQHIVLKAASLKMAPAGKRWVERTLQGQGGVEEPPIAQTQLSNQPVVTSS